MRRAAHAATIGFAALAVFEAALAAGAPLGDAAWGGSAAHLTTGQRVASAVTAAFWIAAIAIAPPSPGRGSTGVETYPLDSSGKRAVVRYYS